MSYLQIRPHSALKYYIDAYWIAEITGNAIHKTKILPDGCIDIIFNIEDDYRTASGSVLMKSESAYLIGTMLHFKEHHTSGSAKLLGIRFKPGAFSYFFNHASLHEFTDQRTELKHLELPLIHSINKDTFACLDRFFLRKLSLPKYSILLLVKDIKQQKGQLKVNELAQKHFTTPRQLERHFKMAIGVSPKDFISIVRYQFACHQIKNNPTRKCLAEIAFEAGYYDHAHLTHEIKRFTGSAPSHL